MKTELLRVEDLCVYYADGSSTSYKKAIKAVDGISFSAFKG